MPVAVEAPTVIVKVDVAVLPAGGVIGLALKMVVTSVGAPETDRVTGELKSFREVTVMFEVPELPGAIVMEMGEAEIEKSGTWAPALPRNFVLAIKIEMKSVIKSKPFALFTLHFTLQPFRSICPLYINLQPNI